MKNTIIMLIFFSFSTVFSQQKGINMIQNKTKDTIFLIENRRIKIETTNGKHLVGRFTIVNDSAISIKNKVVQLDSIVKIRKASMFSAIVSPVAITIGAVFLTGGIAGALAGGYGGIFAILLIPPGLALFIIPQTTNNHVREKWKYQIVNEMQ